MQQIEYTELLWDTPLAAHQPADIEALDDTSQYALLQLLALYKYGGLWLDAGVLLTQDMGRLGRLEWVAAWANSSDSLVSMVSRGVAARTVLELANDFLDRTSTKVG